MKGKGVYEPGTWPVRGALLQFSVPSLPVACFSVILITIIGCGRGSVIGSIGIVIFIVIVSIVAVVVIILFFIIYYC